MAEAKIVLSAQDKTAAAFRSLNKSLHDSDAMVGRFGSSMIALAAAALAPTALFVAFDRLNKSAGNLQDIAEIVGDNAAAFASLNLAAGITGKSMDDVAAFAVKLTKNLTGVDDESKAAGAAIKALGLDLEKFKTQSPSDQLEAIAKALATFDDGPKKTAVLEALAKGGAQLLPFLKELGQEGGRQVLLTEDQIRLADEYSDKQARLRTQISLHAQAIATLMLPAYNALSETFLEVIKGIAGVQDGSTALKNDTGIQDWAKDAATWLGHVVDAGDGVYRTFTVVGKSIGGIGAAVAAQLQGEFRQSARIIDEMGADIANTLERETFGEKLARRLAAASGVTGGQTAGDFARGDRNARKQIDFDGKVKKDGKDEAAQLAKAQRDFDIEAIKNAAQELVGTYSNAEKIMEAVRAVGLLDEAEYYKAKRAFLNLDAKAKEDALEAEIARYQKESLTGKDKLENDKKIAAAQAELAKLRGKTAADMTVLGIQEAAAIKRVAKGYEEARIAAELYLAVSGKQYQRELAAFGRGDGARDKAAASSQIDDRYQGQRDELESQKRLLEFEGKFTADARRQYEERLAIINESNAKALDQWESYYSDLLAKQGNWENGATRALENYMESTAKVAGQTEQLFTKAFEGMEDALVDFVKTGKLDFKSLVDSIIADLARIVIRQQVTGPLAGWLKGLLSGGGGSSGINAPGGANFGGDIGFDNPYSLAVGTNYVPQDMVALLHKGEAVVPKEYNDGGRGGGGPSVVVNINNTIGDVASKSNVVDGMKTVRASLLGELQRRDTYGRGR